MLALKVYVVASVVTMTAVFGSIGYVAWCLRASGGF